MQCKLKLAPDCLKIKETTGDDNKWNKNTCWNCIMYEVKKMVEYRKLETIKDEKEKINETRMANMIKCKDYYYTHREEILEYFRTQTRQRRRIKEENMKNIYFVKRMVQENMKKHNEYMKKRWEKEKEIRKNFNFFAPEPEQIPKPKTDEIKRRNRKKKN